MNSFKFIHKINKMNPVLSKRTNNKESHFQPTNNKVLNYENNSNTKNYYSTSIHSYRKLKTNENEVKICNQKNQNLNSQSFESLNESCNPNNNMNMNNMNKSPNFYGNKITDYNRSQYNSDYFCDYQYYDPSLSAYNPLPLSKNEKIKDTKYNNMPLQITSNNNEYIKYNPNYFNQRKKIITKNSNKNEININNISNNNFIPKRIINNINNSKYGELSKRNFFSENPTQYYGSFNNNFINYLSQNNYNEDSFNDDIKEEKNTNSNNNNTQINKLTRYDIRKKKSITTGQTFFIQKAQNPKNYKFFECKKNPTNNKQKQNMIKTDSKTYPNKDQIKTEKNVLKEKNINENDNTNNNDNMNLNANLSAFLEKEKEVNDDIINNHNFIIIKTSSSQNKKKEENDSKVKVDNYKYKEIKVKGPDNYKPVMKLRIGINGEKFYEKFVPEKKVIKYTYEPICKIINSKNMNNVAFKKIVSHCHSGIRKKYKKLNPDLLKNPASNVIITSESINYKGNVVENINDNKNNAISDNIKEEKKEEDNNLNNKNVREERM